MNVKKPLLFFSFIMLILTSNIVFSDESTAGKNQLDLDKFSEDGTVQGDDVPEGTSGEAPPSTEVNQGGAFVSITGQTTFNANSLDTEQAKTDSGAEMENVEGLRGDGKGGFNADYSESFSYMGFNALNANSIHASVNSLTIGSADKIKYNGMELTNAELLYANEDALSIVNAEKAEGQGLKAEDIININ